MICDTILLYCASHELPYVTNVNPAAKDQLNMQILLEKYPKGDKLMEVYNTEEDAAGLYITGLVELFKYIRSNMRIGKDLELYCC